MITWVLQFCKCGHGKSTHELYSYHDGSERLGKRRVIEARRYGKCASCPCPDFVKTSRRFKRVYSPIWRDGERRPEL